MKAKVRALPRTFLRFGITDMKLCGAHLGELCARRGSALASLCQRQGERSALLGSPCTGEPRSALRRATVMRTKILSVTPINPLGVTAPLTSKGSQENGVNAFPCRRYNPSVFSACETSRKASSPYTGEPRFALRFPRRVQGSRDSRSILLGDNGGAMRHLRHVRGNEKIFPQHLKL